MQHYAILTPIHNLVITVRRTIVGAFFSPAKAVDFRFHFSYPFITWYSETNVGVFFSSGNALEFRLSAVIGLRVPLMLLAIALLATPLLVNVANVINIVNVGSVLGTIANVAPGPRESGSRSHVPRDGGCAAAPPERGRRARARPGGRGAGVEVGAKVARGVGRSRKSSFESLTGSSEVFSCVQRG